MPSQHHRGNLGLDPPDPTQFVFTRGGELLAVRRKRHTAHIATVPFKFLQQFTGLRMQHDHSLITTRGEQLTITRKGETADLPRFHLAGFADRSGGKVNQLDLIFQANRQGLIIGRKGDAGCPMSKSGPTRDFLQFLRGCCRSLAFGQRFQFFRQINRQTNQGNGRRQHCRET